MLQRLRRCTPPKPSRIEIDLVENHRGLRQSCYDALMAPGYCESIKMPVELL